MATAAGAISPQPELEPLLQLLQYASSGLEEEHKLLASANSTVHSLAKSIYFANSEVVYAYLVRRSLAAKGFSYPASHEEWYPSLHGQHVDLQLTLPGGDNKPQRCGIEMKYVSDEGDKALGDVLNDITKLLCEPEYERRFVLLFPMCSMSGLVDARHFAEHLQKFGATNPANWKPFSYRVVGEQSFECQPHNFKLTLIEVLPAG